MLQHVYERASQARYLTSTIIATDDERILEVARNFGARVRMTRSDHPSGTDRVAEIASAENCDIVVNIQGDEPLIDPDAIDAAILPMVHDSDIQMATLKKRIDHPSEILDPNVVKVVTDLAGDAIYFCRYPIPHYRDAAPARDARNPGPRPAGPGPYFKHIGLYLYQRDFLLGYSALPVGPLEQAERLEQLRALENGLKIRVVETDSDSLGVDTPQDLERVALLFAGSLQRVEEHG
jgi:3-deoxy-manno-octulosonate cytidylyltransferase (CMP-KDO synthetase)